MGNNLRHPSLHAVLAVETANLQPSLHHGALAFEQVVAASLGKFLPCNHGNKVGIVFAATVPINSQSERRDHLA